MIDALKPYPKYKDSGSRWLGYVPSHWDVLPLRGVLVERKEKNDPVKTKNILSLSLRTGVIPYAEKGPGGNKAKEDLSAYMLAYPGDIVLNSMNVIVGSVGLSKYFGAVSPVYYMLYPRNADDFVTFFDKVFQDRSFQRSLFGLGNGILVVQSKSSGQLNTIRMRIPMARLRRIQLPRPKADEQAAIVKFLDHVNGRIDSAIRAKKKLIALLNEQKQTIVHRAITCGLDPTVHLKPSGIPWLGNIPKHWQILRAKYLFREVDERSISGSEELLSVSHITGVTPRSQKTITMFKAQSYIGHKLCRPGDLVVNTMWAWMAALGVSAYTGIVSPAYAVYRPRHAEKLVGHYIDLLLRTKPYVSNIICRSTGVRASRLRLYPEEFFRLPIILPPVTEQSRIVENIAAETAHLEASIIHAEREIALLREYRIRLTADVVTGKLDVREATRKLPDTAEEAGATQEIEELTDVEPEDVEA
jgi:type I restriction enzyme S subunit